MIEVTSLTKVYGIGDGAVTAVDDVSLSVPAGQVFGILGRSGAGKTTLMRCLTALERPTSGSVTIGEVNLTELSASGLRKARHRMGMIFQHFNLLGSRTAADNIAFPLEVQGVPAAERRARVAELIELVGLQGREHAFPSQLSGGQKQRVGIARALAAHPDVLFCDEATSALDPATESLVQQALDRLLEGRTTFIVAHRLRTLRAAHRVAVLARGRLVELGAYDALLARPGEFRRLHDLGDLAGPRPPPA